MSTNPFLLACNGASPPAGWRGDGWSSVDPRRLWTYTHKANVSLKLTDITDQMVKRLPPVLEDLVELAALVYAADQWCKRTAGNSFDYGAKWHRTFRVVVAVRDADFWNRQDVRDALSEALGFLTDDDYEFAFTENPDPPQFQEYLELTNGQPFIERPDRVTLFSGGLDSLAGAAEEVFRHGRRVALVSHNPVNHIGKLQRDLINEIRNRIRSRDPHLQPLHFPVKANKDGELALDTTQRSRSFLFASMAAAVANLFDLDRIYFYENGIVSVNLPLCGQEVGGRATRTTHPRSLALLQHLLSLVLDREFTIENEYLWKTKEDVMHAVSGRPGRPTWRSSLSVASTPAATRCGSHIVGCVPSVFRAGLRRWGRTTGTTTRTTSTKRTRSRPSGRRTRSERWRSGTSAWPGRSNKPVPRKSSTRSSRSWRGFTRSCPCPSRTARRSRSHCIKRTPHRCTKR